MSDDRTCGGHCCERFTLPFSPAEGWESYRAVAARSRGIGREPGKRYYLNIEVVMPMVIYLGTYPYDPMDGQPAKTMIHHYTCRFFDKKHRLCRIYEQRPDVCQRFPDDKCRYVQCTWQASLEGRVRDGQELSEAMGGLKEVKEALREISVQPG